MKAVFEKKCYAVSNLVTHLGDADKSSTTVFSKPDASQSIQTVENIIFYLTKECKYYSYSLLQNFVKREEYKDAKILVEEYTRLVYLPLLEEMDLMTANEWVNQKECQPSESTSILEVKIDVKSFLLKEEKHVSEVLYRYLKLPNQCLHFIGAKHGCIVLVYKMSVKIRELLLYLTAKKLPILVNLNVTHIIIDNEMELTTTDMYHDKVRIVFVKVLIIDF